MAKILIVDASASGHHGDYLLNIVERFCNLGERVVLVTAIENKEHAVIKKLYKVCSLIEFIFIPLDEDSKKFGGLRNDILRERAYWRFNKNAYKAAIRLGALDKIVLPYADCCINAMSVMGLPFGCVPVAAITMRPIFHHQTEGVMTPCNPYAQYIKRKIFEKFISRSNLIKLLTIDPTLNNFARKKEIKKSAWGKVSYLPDPIKKILPGDKLKSRFNLGLSADLRVVLLYGSLDVRKGVEYLLNALSSLPVDGPSVILAGVMSPSIRTLVQKSEYKLLIKQGRLIILDKYISGEDERDLLLACDAVWLGYVGHFSMSGVLVKAAQCGRPVIATRRGLLGWFARDLPGAQIIDVDQPDQVRDALAVVSSAPGEVPAALLNHNWDYAIKVLLDGFVSKNGFVA